MVNFLLIVFYCTCQPPMYSPPCANSIQRLMTPPMDRSYRTQAAGNALSVTVWNPGIEMSSYLLITCVLSSLATTGYSLTCIECTSQNDQICNGTSVTCPPGHYSCILSYGVTTLAEMKISNIYIRQCGESSLCSRAGTMSVPNGRLKTSTTCCDTDNCTPPQPVLSEDTNGKNGLKCKGCFSPNSKTCQTETVMDCTGKETMCMTQLTSTSGSIFSTTISRGCSTKEMCQPTHQVWNLGAMVVNVESKCANSGVYLHQSLFLLIISVCLFLKLMC